MALERQITFKTNVINTIDDQVNTYLKENAVDPAGVQIIIDNNRGVKTATLSYGAREEIKKLYDAQGRTYSDADAVTYCHTKDIVVPLNSDLDKEVNTFISDDNINLISIARYFTAVNQGAFIMYINLEERKQKETEKEAEVAKLREELAQKMATKAVKDVDLENNDTVEKYASLEKEKVEETVDNIPEETVTAGLNQVEGEVKTPETTITTTSTEENTTVETPKKKGIFGKNK